MAKRRERGSLAGAFARGPKTEVDFLLPPKLAFTEVPAAVEPPPPPAPIRFVPEVREPLGLDELTGFEPTGSFDESIAPQAPIEQAPVVRFTTDTVVVEATAPDRPLTSSVTLSRAALARAIEERPAAPDDTPVVQVRLRPTIEPPLVSRPASAKPAAKVGDVWAAPRAPRASIEIDLDETQVATRIEPEPDIDALREAWTPAFPPLPPRHGRVRRLVGRVVRLVLALI